MAQLKYEHAQDIAIDFVKERKSVADVHVTMTEMIDGVWVIKGTCPIDLAGHPWRETFEVKVDQKGKIKASSFRLM
ncbi:MAG: hypothetical protein JSV05_09170 [Candidatus Bathyarchaeota archaeon]|nr:MAG: hypothetical protein JSV05_09170 [Candidatus Bathyarchaeota archaeon]